MTRPRCQFCGKPFETLRAVNHHISLSKPCHKKWMKEVLRKEEPSPSPKRQKLVPDSLVHDDDEMEGEHESLDNGADPGDDFVLPSPPSPPRKATVEDVEDEGETYPRTKSDRFVESYPGPAGEGLRKSKTRYEAWFENQEREGKNSWDPFASEEEWALTMWLLKNVGQKSTDQFLKLPIVRFVFFLTKGTAVLTNFYQINSKEKLSFYNSYSFLKKVDQLPIGPDWKCSLINVTGDRLDDEGKLMTEQLELWHRDPIECVKELIGNPAFADYISYVAERVYMDDKGKVRVFDEMWTGNWWWDIQV